MKRIVSITLVALMVLALSACTAAPTASASPSPSPAASEAPSAPAESPAATLKDGTYKAESAEFDASTGYKDSVEVTVKDGKITEVNWDATHKDGGKTKKERSEAGEYDMKNNGLKWHEQAAAMEAALISAQDPAALVVTDEGKTDAVTGVSIHVSGFVALAAEALAKAK